MRNPASLLLLLGLEAGLAFAAFAQAPLQRTTPQRLGVGWVEEIRGSIPVVEGGHLVLRLDRGSVEIQPGAPSRLQCLVHLTAYSENPQQAQNCLNDYHLQALPIPHGVQLSGQGFCGTDRGALEAEYQVEVPIKFDVSVHTRGGNIHVTKLEGPLRAETTGGEIVTGDVQGPVWVSTGAGTIDLGNIGSSVEARTAGGAISVGDVNGGATLNTSGGDIAAGIVNGSVSAQTGAGNVVLEAASGPVEVETAGGQIHLGECGNTVQAHTAAGNIQVGSARGQVSVQSAGGSIDLLQAMSGVVVRTGAGQILAQIDANRNTFRRSELTAQIGDVDVFLPPQLPVNLHALITNPFGRRIISDFPMKVETADSRFMMGPLQENGRVDGGGVPLDIRTTMGNIMIRRLDPAALARMKAYQAQFWTRWRESERDQAAMLVRVQSLRAQLALQQAELQSRLADLNRRFTAAAAEDERAELSRRMQLLRRTIRDQMQQVWAQQSLVFQQVQQQSDAFERQLREMTRQLERQAREQVKYEEEQQQ
jgi:DUF4097 and DUF4098 domain-containing protein YvlB